MVSFLDYLYDKTLLLEDSFQEENGITAEQFESVVAYVYNIKHNGKNRDIKSIDRKVILYYQRRKQLMNQIVAAIDKKLGGKNVAELAKLRNNQTVKSAALQKLATFKINMSDRGLKIPKTDIYSEVDNNVRISLKWYDDCQLVSGGGPESLLLLNELIGMYQKSKKHDFTRLQKLVNQTKNWNSSPKDDVAAFSAKYVEDIKQELQMHVDSDTKFKRDLVKLATTGTYKFDVGSVAIPTYVLEWSAKKPELTEMFELNEYIDYVMSKRHVIINFRPKTGASTRYLVLSVKVR